MSTPQPTPQEWLRAVLDSPDLTTDEKLVAVAMAADAVRSPDGAWTVTFDDD